MLTELSAPVVDQAIRDEIARHLKLSSGFGGGQDAEAEDAFRAALAHLERVLGLCLFPRPFLWRGRLDGEGRAVVGAGPVRAITLVNRVLGGGAREAVEPGFFRAEQGVDASLVTSAVRICDELEITFDAGFGEDWSATPADLRRAVLMTAAHLYDNRHAAGDRMAETPYAVSALIQPWRRIRLSVGGAA